MAKGNCILLNGEHGKGRYQPLYNGTGDDLYPGTIVQIDETVADRAGVATAVVYNRDADGNMPKGAMFVVLETMQRLRGTLMTDAIPSGEIFQGYAPVNGDELNLLLKDADTGTSTNDVAKGTILMVDDGTGLLIATTGTPEEEVAVTREDQNNMDGSALTWCQWGR